MSSVPSRPRPRGNGASAPRPPSRRDFLKNCASGLMVWVVLGPALGAQTSEADAPITIKVRPKEGDDFNAFLRIGEDGRVTCYTGKVEMGQGPITSLPQMLAEELDVALDDVEIVMGDTDLCPAAWEARTLAHTRAHGAR